MGEPIGFRGIYHPEPAIEHAIEHWSKRQDVTPKDWITAIRAKSDQRQNDVLCGLYNALHYYEHENESNLARSKEKDQLFGREQKQRSKMEKKASNWKYATWAVSILSVAAFLITFNIMSEKLGDANSQKTAPHLVLPSS